MSNSKTAIGEIKKLMVQFGFLAEEPTLQSFKLEDDTILEAEKLEIGNPIFKILNSYLTWCFVIFELTFHIPFN